MKYQIILESSELLTDQEFEDLFKDLDIWDQYKERPQFKLVEARSLEGIQAQLWEKKDKIIDGFLHATEPTLIVEESFEEIKDLFKL